MLRKLQFFEFLFLVHFYRFRDNWKGSLWFPFEYEIKNKNLRRPHAMIVSHSQKQRNCNEFEIKKEWKQKRWKIQNEEIGWIYAKLSSDVQQSVVITFEFRSPLANAALNLVMYNCHNCRNNLQRLFLPKRIISLSVDFSIRNQNREFFFQFLFSLS